MPSTWERLPSPQALLSTLPFHFHRPLLLAFILSLSGPSAIHVYGTTVRNYKQVGKESEFKPFIVSAPKDNRCKHLIWAFAAFFLYIWIYITVYIYIYLFFLFYKNEVVVYTCFLITCLMTWGIWVFLHHWPLPKGKLYYLDELSTLRSSVSKASGLCSVSILLATAGMFQCRLWK